ncbi:Transcriptional regulatory protein CusR [Hartmannibacter diazotrophicus]|uniref:Transcriptional regulatory protein CusR n=1 Tax=Hartmannibacter diazotrophicus TaxID=1482074 RepID=A0A2C9D7F8_9HYPH|nr:response regulator transcription factor [Hartmannibacter diazotrophicus]SON56237.1 Transcriptional regulatory protein CusR [Hartmannibacter diazotrophicus]
MRMLLVEDSPRLNELLTERIHDAGWRLDTVSTLAEAQEAALSDLHDLILVDLGLPDGDGLDLIKTLRRSGRTVPIIIVTARGSIEERIAGLDAGADDYLVKPFHHDEFLARCRAMLRRVPQALQPKLEVGQLIYDPALARVTASGAEVALAPRERAVIEILMRDAERVVPKRKLETALSEYGEELSTNALELAVSRLRRRLDGLETGVALETVRGVGYLLRATAS